MRRINVGINLQRTYSGKKRIGLERWLEQMKKKGQHTRGT